MYSSFVVLHSNVTYIKFVKVQKTMVLDLFQIVFLIIIIVSKVEILSHIALFTFLQEMEGVTC